MHDNKGRWYMPSAFLCLILSGISGQLAADVEGIEESLVGHIEPFLELEERVGQEHVSGLPAGVGR